MRRYLWFMKFSTIGARNTPFSNGCTSPDLCTAFALPLFLPPGAPADFCCRLRRIVDVLAAVTLSLFLCRC